MLVAPNLLEIVTGIEMNRSASFVFQLTSRHPNPVLSSELTTLAHDANILVPDTINF